MLYLGAVISGIGGGAVYSVCVGNAVKWFADRRGLAVGLTAAGYGAGAALTVIPMRMVIGSSGYEAAFFWFGLVQGGVVFLVGWFLRGPLPGEARGRGVVGTGDAVDAQLLRPMEMLATPTFWLLYLMFVMISASGLMATAQIALVAKNYGISNEVLFLGASTLTVALIVDNVMNGLARPFFGWISDQIGREPTMALAFGLGGIAYWLLGALGTNPWAFVLFAGLIFFTWGEIFSLFPSTCTDTFGSKFATVNTSLLYTAKGTSAFLVPLANVLKEATRRLARGVRGHGDRQFCRRRARAYSSCARCARGSRRRATPRSRRKGRRRIVVGFSAPPTASSWRRGPPFAARMWKCTTKQGSEKVMLDEATETSQTHGRAAAAEDTSKIASWRDQCRVAGDRRLSAGHRCPQAERH